MRQKFVLALIFVVVVLVTGSAQAQYGIGRFEQLQILSNDLKETARGLYLSADRQSSRFSRSERYMVENLYRIYARAADFENQLQRNHNDPDALRRSYQRLYSVWYDAEYSMQGRGYGPFLNEFRQVSLMVNQLGRRIPGVEHDDRYDEFDEDFEGYDQ